MLKRHYSYFGIGWERLALGDSAVSGLIHVMRAHARISRSRRRDDVDAVQGSSVSDNLECRVVDTQLVNRYDLFVLEVLKAWRDWAQHSPRTIHHHGCGVFVVDGKIVRTKSLMP
jgi:hypothetical protein